MSMLKGYTFNHIGDMCNDDDCIVTEAAVSCETNEFITANVYKQTDTKFYTIFWAQVGETDDLRIHCACCGAAAQGVREDPDNIINVG